MTISYLGSGNIKKQTYLYRVYGHVKKEVVCLKLKEKKIEGFRKERMTNKKREKI